MITVKKFLDDWENVLCLNVDVSCLHGLVVFDFRVSIITPMPFMS